MARGLHECLIFHCAAALAGIKPASLVSCNRSDYPDFALELRELNPRLNPKDIFFAPVCGCKKRVFLLVFRARPFSLLLGKPEVAGYLRQEGYPVSLGINAVISHLRKRLAGSREFPHEVGVLLGYPVSDVTAFVRNKGAHSKLSGYWKVYSNEKAAAVLFGRYDRCREVLCKRLQKDKCLYILFGAA